MALHLTLAAWALERWSVESPTAEEIVQDDVEIEHEGAEDDIDADARSAEAIGVRKSPAQNTAL